MRPHFYNSFVQFLIFLQFFSGVMKYFWKDVVCMAILALQKEITTFILRTIHKRTHCPSIVTLALLLFLTRNSKLIISVIAAFPWL